MGIPGAIIHGTKRKPSRVSGLSVIGGTPAAVLPSLI